MILIFQLIDNNEIEIHAQKFPFYYMFNTKRRKKSLEIVQKKNKITYKTILHLKLKKRQATQNIIIEFLRLQYKFNFFLFAF